MKKIKSLNITAQKRLNSLREIRVLRMERDMYVVIHKAMSHDLAFKGSACLSQQIHEVDLVAVIQKNRPSVLTASHDVIVGIFGLEPEWSHHDTARCKEFAGLVSIKEPAFKNK
jgi:hypothetical protein